MKRVIIPILILIMILPIIVLAETCDSNSVRIESISVKNKNGSVQEVTEATKNGTEINVNLNMLEVGDSIIYTTTIKNYSEEDYYLDNSYLIVDTDYLEYSITSEDDSNLIQAQSTKDFDIKVKYRTQVDDTAFVAGEYKDNNNLSLKLATETNNPFTTDYIALYLAIFYISTFFLIYLFIKRKKVEEVTILLLISLLVPLSVKALCKAEISVNSKVIIVKGEVGTFTIDCSPVQQYHYYKGTTFGEWIKSSLYTDNINGEFETLQDCEKVFGTNKGCAYVRTDHPYVYNINHTTYKYDLEDCENADQCEAIINQMYDLKYAYRKFDTRQACANFYLTDEDRCTEMDGEYYFFYTGLEESEESCNANNNSNMIYKQCTVIPIIYKEIIVDEVRYDTEQMCEWNKPEGETCRQIDVNVYSPTIKQNDVSRGTFEFKKSNMIYWTGNMWGGCSTDFEYDTEIEEKNYYCGCVG